MRFEHKCCEYVFTKSMGYLTDKITIFDGLIHNLLPVTIGNIIGGCLVALFVNERKITNLFLYLIIL